MSLVLRKFTAEDLPDLERWRDEIDSDRYMERLSPVSYDYSGFEGWGLDYVWYVISVDGCDVGGIWFDLKKTNRSIGIMGIVIGRSDSLGRGIGRKAIEKAVPLARSILGFDIVRLHVRQTNARAIACYRNCGFIPTGEGSKLLEDKGKVPFYRMELYLKPFPAKVSTGLPALHSSGPSMPASSQRNTADRIGRRTG